MNSVKIIFTILCTIGLLHSSPLIKFFEGEYDEIGVKGGYINMQNDTIVPSGKYTYCFTDTIHHIGFVLVNNSLIFAIDARGKELYEVLNYDNGPDPLSDGLFRIKKNGKVGYANAHGEIIIEPQYQCAFPFKDGKARVALVCRQYSVGEYTGSESKEWLIVNKKGEVLEKKKQ